MRKDTLSTGQVARLCDVSLQTVIRWVDGGLLPGHRIPGSEHRRIYRSDFIKFLVDHKMDRVEVPK